MVQNHDATILWTHKFIPVCILNIELCPLFPTRIRLNIISHNRGKYNWKRESGRANENKQVEMNVVSV